MKLKFRIASDKNEIGEKSKLAVPFLMYHHILKNNHSGGTPSSIFESQFDSQMKYLADNNFNSLAISDLLKLNGNRRDLYPQKLVVITFDDGYENNYSYAFPILKRYQLMATFFVIVDRIDSPDYLTWKQIKEMFKAGMDIQSHTFNHQPLESLSRLSIKHELQASKIILEKKLRKAVNFLSYPHGSYNEDIIEVAKDVGYLACCTSKAGFFETRGDPFQMSRIDIRRTYNLSAFKKIVHKDRFLLKKIIFITGLKKKIQTIIGMNNWNWLYRKRWYTNEERNLLSTISDQQLNTH